MPLYRYEVRRPAPKTHSYSPGTGCEEPALNLVSSGCLRHGSFWFGCGSRKLMQIAVMDVSGIIGPRRKFGRIVVQFRLVPCPIADGESAPTGRTKFCPRADR